MQFETSRQLELKERAAGLAAAHNDLGAEAMLARLVEAEFPGRIGLVSSFGTEAAVLLHMVARIDPYVPVIFLDTWKHFPQTLTYRDALVERLGLCNTQIVTPRPALLVAEDPQGDLHARDANHCCHIRKTRPMLQALRTLDCWITGRRRNQTDTRRELPRIEVQGRWIKVNPLADWSARDISAYFKTYDLPPHPLKAQGYPSVGCAPCTRPVSPHEDARAGRWAESDKTECGIHIEDGRVVRR